MLSRIGLMTQKMLCWMCPNQTFSRLAGPGLRDSPGEMTVNMSTCSTSEITRAVPLVSIFVVVKYLQYQIMNFSLGTKFVVKQKRGMRKQFLVVDDEPLLVFVEKKGKKFTDCQSYEDITASVKCKVIFSSEEKNYLVASPVDCVWSGQCGPRERGGPCSPRPEDRQDVGGELLSVHQNRPRPLGWGLLLRSDY